VTARIALTTLVAAAALASAAAASAPPVGPLPAGPTQRITTQKGQLVAVALPSSAAGKVWRVARPYDSTVLRQVAEQNVGSRVVVVYSATGRGSTTVVYALTRGETAHAYAAKRFAVTVK
jgi:hypothetical protein